MSTLSTAVPDFLSRLESIEARLLSWGLVDGSFDEDELERHAEHFLEEVSLQGESSSPQEFVDELLDRKLVIRFLEGTRPRFRTRMGETIRLLARLRQLFPSHLNGRRWQQAKTLVADYRLLLRPRQFPRRQFTRNEILAGIEAGQRLSALQTDLVTAILDLGDGRTMELAEFQVRATRRIVMEARGRRASGSIVCAGTGSGKTLAFYLPAFLHLAPTLDASRWTRCLALYPRNELLKDQLSETFRKVKRIEPVLARHGKRKLTIATLFSSTPTNRNSFQYEKPLTGWTKRGSGFVCPFLRCPEDDCGGDLIWRDTDRNTNVERLVCQDCGATTDPDVLILTRERLLRQPADVLFTTTEMLNQRLGDSRYGRLFGVAVPSQEKPPLVLLDEVHTYSGTSGAQVGMLLRRWRCAARTEPHFVGLSATLADAARFFAQLVGVDSSHVEAIAPFPADLVRAGMEYMVALRGDPASSASLLSTTIQAAMLMRRVLDPISRPSQGLYGTREFVFGDDLDVINRLYFNLLDAEGMDSWGRPNPRKPDGSLANLRSSALPETGLRQRFGQSWKACEDIGHSLQAASLLRLGRTTSQDAGVVAEADIVVASASLEVGFNDPQVGAVLQHKSPRDSAQFLQRKGRAGRRLEMRPWTVIVLSDYGRDRLTWQSYELLFDPELAPRTLPISNRYVLRMQAVYAFMDWIAEQLRRQSLLPQGRVWQDFSAPPETVDYRRGELKSRQAAAAAIVEDLLIRNDRHQEISEYLQRALQQNSDTITALLWEPPRALMTAVLPTLLRRLKTGWKRTGMPDQSERDWRDFHVPNNPLPEFVPGQLFSDLNLPEVTIDIPAQQRNDKPRVERLPILQALREFAPGRVSRRFGILNQWARHWIAPADLTPTPRKQLELHQYLMRFDDLGEFQYRSSVTGEVHSIRCVRPYEIQPRQPPKAIQDTTNAFLIWQSQIVPGSDGLPVDIPSPSNWASLIREVRFFTHGHQAPLEIRRFATGSEATFVSVGGNRFESEIAFVDAPQSASNVAAPPSAIAVGFAADVDGVVFRVALPSGFGVDRASPELIRGLRTALFRDRIIAATALDGIANRFRRQWLADVYVAALSESSLASGRPLTETWQSRTESDFDGILQVIFQSIPITGDSDDEANSLPVEEHQQQLYADLSDLLRSPAVVEVLRTYAPVLWSPPDETWFPWLSRKFRTTLGAALLEAVQQLCQDFGEGDLILDIEPGPRPPDTPSTGDDTAELWLTESAVGGGGIVENFLIRYGEDPRRFFDLVEAALKPSDYEIVDDQLSLFLDWVVSECDSPIRHSVRALRNAFGGTHEGYASAFRNLLSQLSQEGMFVCHSVVAALGMRILKPGSNEQTDRLIHDLVRRWKQQEARLGIEIDLRVFASVQAQDDSLDTALGDLEGGPVAADRRPWRFGAMTSVLWPRGGTMRSRRLAVYNPYAELPLTEHDLVRNVLARRIQVVDVTTPDWREQADRILVLDSSVELRVPTPRGRLLREAILSMIVRPVDAGFLLLAPRIRGAERETGFIGVVLELAEGAQ